MEDDSGYVYEESTEEQNSGGNGPFYTAVGVLIAIFILAGGCALVSSMNRGSTPDQTAEVAVIETQNAVIAVTNAAVTQTIAAMETEAARPTETPTPPPPTYTPEPSPSNTPRATNTPVVVDIEIDNEADVAVGEGTPNVSGTSVFEGEAENSSPTPIPVSDSNGSGTLPDTGFELWAIALAGIVLVGILVAARRMRKAS